MKNYQHYLINLTIRELAEELKLILSLLIFEDTEHLRHKKNIVEALIIDRMMKNAVLIPIQ